MSLLRRLVALVIPLAVAMALLLVGIAWLASSAPPPLQPRANSHKAPADSAVSITYQQEISAATVNSATFAIRGMSSGRQGSYTVSGTQIVFEPGQPFLPGELVQATATTRTLFLSGGGPISPTVWQFRISPEGGSGVLADSGKSYPVGATFDVALGDLDGDGDLDAISTHSINGSLMWTNSGGALSQTLAIDSGVSDAVALGDLDGDGDLDAFFGNSSGDSVWLNLGGGVLSQTVQWLGSMSSYDVALGDLDGDGDLDAVTANYNFTDRQSYIWLNDGHGIFSSGQSLAGLGEAVSLGDVDSDGDLDVVLGLDARNSGSSTQVWLNDGLATFVQGQGFGAATRTRGNALGDLNGDGHVDIVAANFSGSDMTNRVWLNDGAGTFSQLAQALGNAFSHQAALGDLDDDGDLDILIANSGPYELWTNDGEASFGRTELSPVGFTADLGDLDGDGDLDALLADINPGALKIWRNTGSPPVASDLSLAVSEGGFVSWPIDTWTYVMTITNEGPAAAENVVLSLVNGVIREVDWTTPPGVNCLYDGFLRSCVIGRLEKDQQVVLTARIVFEVQLGSSDLRAIEIEIPVMVSGDGLDPAPQNNTTTLATLFYNCLTVTDWDCVTTEIWCQLISVTDLARRAKAFIQALDAMPPFNLADLYEVRDGVMAGTAKGQHYIDLYYTHDAEIGSLLMGDADLRNQAINTLTAWQPNMAALTDGEGGSVVITAAQVQKVDDFLNAISAVASPELQGVIAEERAKLPPPAEFVGMTMEEARGLVIGYSMNLPLIRR